VTIYVLRDAWIGSLISRLHISFSRKVMFLRSTMLRHAFTGEKSVHNAAGLLARRSTGLWVKEDIERTICKAMTLRTQQLWPTQRRPDR